MRSKGLFFASLYACFLGLFISLTSLESSASGPSYVRTDATPSSSSRSMIFDAAHQHIFAAVRDRSRVEVFSSVTHKRVATIQIPNPSSVDLSPDGKRIAVGTNSQYIYLIDTSSLLVVDRVHFRGIGGPLYPNFEPTDVVYTSDGKAILRVNETNSTTGVVTVQWDPATNSFTPIGLSDGFMARSGDYSKVLTGSLNSGGGIFLYDANTGRIANTSYFDSFNSVGAANPDGTQFAVYAISQGSWSRVILLDSNLNEVGFLDVGNVWGLAYSADGRYLYISQNYDPPSLITVLDTSTTRVIGQISDSRLGGSGRTHIQGIDNTGTLFGSTTMGVTFLDSAFVSSLPTPYPDLKFPAAINPTSGSTTSSTPVSISGAGLGSGTAVFGTAQSSFSGSGATAPPSSQAGPVDVVLNLTNGWTAMAPEGFSYGPYIYALLENAGSPQGGDAVEILGYGLANSDNISVKIGGATANVVNRYDAASTTLKYYGAYDFPLPLQSIVVTTPGGTPGWADVTITTSAGTTTLQKGFNYLAKSKNYPKSSQLSDPTYDRFRNRVYVSNLSQIEVLDLSSETWIAPLLPPATSGSTSDLRGMVLTPDGNSLLVTDFGAGKLHVFDLVGGSAYSIDLTSSDTNSYSPGQIVWANGRPYFATVTGGGSGGGAVYELDLANKSFSPLSYGKGAFICGDPHLAASGDGNRLFIAFGNCSSGSTVEFDFSTGDILYQPLNNSLYDAAASADGNLFATGGGNAGGGYFVPFVMDSDLYLSSRPWRPDYYMQSFEIGPGQTAPNRCSPV